MDDTQLRTLVARIADRDGESVVIGILASAILESVAEMIREKRFDDAIRVCEDVSRQLQSYTESLRNPST